MMQKRTRRCRVSAWAGMQRLPLFYGLLSRQDVRGGADGGLYPDGLGTAFLFTTETFVLVSNEMLRFGFAYLDKFVAFGLLNR